MMPINSKKTGQNSGKTNLCPDVEKNKQRETTIWCIWNKPLIYWQIVLECIRLHSTFTQKKLETSKWLFLVILQRKHDDSSVGLTLQLRPVTSEHVQGGATDSPTPSDCKHARRDDDTVFFYIDCMIYCSVDRRCSSSVSLITTSCHELHCNFWFKVSFSVK